MESVWSVSKLSTKSVGSLRELVANVFTPPTPTGQNSFELSSRRRRRCVLGFSISPCRLRSTKILQSRAMVGWCRRWKEMTSYGWNSCYPHWMKNTVVTLVASSSWLSVCTLPLLGVVSNVQDFCLTPGLSRIYEEIPTAIRR